MFLMCIFFLSESARMLQQILKDMWVDPEILAGLDEEQKQTLFCKMREEQVRRWTVWDQSVNAEPPSESKKKTKRSVGFLQGTNGEPWVWVMGEHENDQSIDDILKLETIDQARKLAEKEAEALRKQVSDFVIKSFRFIFFFRTCTS